MTAEERIRVLTRLNGRNQVEAFEAAKAIWNDSDKRLERGLLLTLRKGQRAFNRAAAAYAMQIITTRKTIRALERTLSSKSEHPKVRGYAAEALAHVHRKQSHDVLLKNMNDRSKIVRFWCIFSLGQMAEKRAIPGLQRLAATDQRQVRGFHSIAKEATDALQEIEKGDQGHSGWRRKGCVFCVRWKSG